MSSRKTGSVGEVHSYIDKHFNEHLEMLRNFLRIPSISLTDTAEGREQVLRAAEATLKMIQDLGAEDTKLVETDGFPVAYGRLMSKNPDAKTLIINCFYDVIPIGKGKWKFPPFEARIVDATEMDLPAKLGKVICGRGTYDHKGPAMGFLNGVKSMLEVTGDVPVNLLIAFEGEEELTSWHIYQFIEKYKDELKKAHGLVYPFMLLDAEGKTCTLKLGNKGIMGVELICQGGEWGGPAEQDLWAGLEAWVDPPAWRLIWALSSLKDPSGKILIDGFYDDVRRPTSEEREMLRKIKAKTNYEEEKKIMGIKKFKCGLAGEDLIEDYIMGSTCGIDGIEAGYTGPAIWTNLPMSARAKMDIRMVPNQRADDILLKLKRHLHTHGFPEIEVNVATTKYDPFRTRPSANIIQAAINAAKKHSIEPVLWPNETGAMPTSLFAEATGQYEQFEFTAWGLGHAGRPHEANEYMTVEGLKLCEKSWTTFLYEYARM